jgi:hypothetical protein
LELENTPNEPQPQGAQSQPSVPGQNNQPGGGGRRRRRRRGKKPGAGMQAQGQPQPQGQQQNRGGQHRQNRPHPGQGGAQGSPGRKGGGGGGARRRRGGGTPFVGPMDHSYRGVGANGNTADRQPRFRQNGRVSEHQPHYMEPEVLPVANIREDAPTRIFCFIEDLFFYAKINEIARKLGVKVEFVKTPEPILERVSDDIPEEDRPALIIFDLNNANVKPFTLIPKLRAKLKKSASIVGFLQHIQGDLKMKAIEAGCDMVVPRSAFSQNLPNLLRRHAELPVEDTPQPGM